MNKPLSKLASVLGELLFTLLSVLTLNAADDGHWQVLTEPLTPTNAILLSVSPHYTLWRTHHETETTPDLQKLHGWRPHRYPMYHLVSTNGLVRTFAAKTRRLNHTENEIGARISIGGSILFPDETLLLSPEDRRVSEDPAKVIPLSFEKDVRKLESVLVVVKPVHINVIVNLNDLNVKDIILVPTRYATNHFRPQWEMFVQNEDTQRVAVIPLYETPVLAKRIRQSEPPEMWPIIAITRESVTAWDGIDWHTSSFESKASLPDDTANGALTKWVPAERAAPLPRQLIPH